MRKDIVKNVTVGGKSRRFSLNHYLCQRWLSFYVDTKMSRKFCKNIYIPLIMTLISGMPQSITRLASLIKSFEARPLGFPYTCHEIELRSTVQISTSSRPRATRTCVYIYSIAIIDTSGFEKPQMAGRRVSKPRSNQFKFKQVQLHL